MMYKLKRVHVLVIVGGVTIGLGLTALTAYLGIPADITGAATNHWCGLFVKDSTGSPVPNLAVRLPAYGTYVYSTDQNGYTGKIWSTGMSNGCPAGLSGVEIPATVLYHNTEYATYLKADANVTLTLGVN